MLYVNKNGYSLNCKKSQQSFCIWWQIIHYHLANLWNRITTKIFDIFRIITLKQQKFSQSDPVLNSQIFKKIAVRSSPDPAKIGFSPDPVRSSPDPCSSLAVTKGIRLVRNEGGKVAIPRVPSHYGGAKTQLGAPNGWGVAEKSKQCHKYFLH